MMSVHRFLETKFIVQGNFCFKLKYFPIKCHCYEILNKQIETDRNSHQYKNSHLAWRIDSGSSEPCTYANFIGDFFELNFMRNKFCLKIFILKKHEKRNKQWRWHWTVCGLRSANRRGFLVRNTFMYTLLQRSPAKKILASIFYSFPQLLVLYMKSISC